MDSDRKIGCDDTQLDRIQEKPNNEEMSGGSQKWFWLSSFPSLLATCQLPWSK